MLNGSCVGVRLEYADYRGVAMHDALDNRTAPRCPAAAVAAVRAHRPGARHPFPPEVFLREMFDDWEALRDRALAPA